MNVLFNTGTLEDCWSVMGRRHFYYSYAAPNYNDTVVLCFCPQELLDAARDMNLVITHLTIVHTGTIGMQTEYVLLGVDQMRLESLENWTTTRAQDVKNYSEIDLHLRPRMLNANTAWVQVWPKAASYVATDDLFIIVRGYIESNLEVGPSPMPVAVNELNVWPWKRV